MEYWVYAVSAGLLLAVIFGFGPDRLKEWREDRRAAQAQRCPLCWRPKVDGDELCWMHKWGGGK